METSAQREFPCAEVWGGNGPIRQAVLLPGLEGTVLSQPCGGGRGGDVYFVSACSAGLFARACLADVVGHGEPVAEMSEWLHGLLRTRINQHDAARIFSDVNRHAFEKGYGAITTALCVTYDAREGELNFCNAGHPPMLHYRRREGTWRVQRLDNPNTGGLRNLAFGVDGKVDYDVGRVKLDEGDLLLLYSDGVTETPNVQRELFGEQRLIDSLNECTTAEHGDLAGRIVESLCVHAGKDDFDHDDVTALIFRATTKVKGQLPWIMVKNRIRKWRLRRSRVA